MPGRPARHGTAQAGPGKPPLHAAVTETGDYRMGKAGLIKERNTMRIRGLNVPWSNFKSHNRMYWEHDAQDVSTSLRLELRVLLDV